MFKIIDIFIDQIEDMDRDFHEMQEQWLENTSSNIAFDVIKGKSWSTTPKLIIKRALDSALRNLPGYTYAERTDGTLVNTKEEVQS